MATPTPIIVTASTTLVQVDTSALLGPYIVRLSNLNLPGSMITVRDSTGNASATNTIVLSTISGIKFLNGGGDSNNIYTINQRYGFLTVTPKTSSIWGVVNTFAFPAESQTANLFQVNVSSLTVSSFATIQTLLVSTSAISTICTNNLFVTGNIVYDQSTIGNVAFYTSTIYAEGDITTKANLYVTSTLSTTFVNASSTIYAPYISTLNINMGGVLNTNSTISTAGPLFVGSSISTTGNLAVGASTFIQGQLLTGSLSSLGSASIAGGLSVMSTIYAQGHIFTQSSITAVSSISTLSHVNMGGSLSTLGNAFISKELYITSSILATGSISSLENVNVAGGISTASNVYIGGSLFVVGAMAINNINACTINVLNSFSTISSLASGGSFNVGGSTIMLGTVSALSNFNIGGLLSTTSSIVGGDSLIIAKNGFFGSTVSTASLGTSSLNANMAFISSLSTGQAAFYSSMQIQGSVSIFSSLAVACNVDVGRTLTTSNLLITGSTFISTLAVTNTVGFALNISSSTLHYGLFSTGGAMNIGGLISTTNALTVGSTIDTQHLMVRSGMSVFSNASFTQDIFALSSLFVGLSTLMIGNVTASTNMSTLGVANFGSSINILGSTIGTAALFNTVVVPAIFNSTLQTSSITASTIAAINTSTNSLIAISSLTQNAYATNIFNSTLNTSSITASTINTINVSSLGQAAFYSSVQIQGGLSVFSSIGATSLAVLSNTTIGGTLNVTGLTTLVNSSNTGTLGVAGTTTLGTTIANTLKMTLDGWNILDSAGGFRILFQANAQTQMYSPTFFEWNTGANTHMMKLTSNVLDNGNPYWLSIGSNHTATCSLDVKGSGKFSGTLNVTGLTSLVNSSNTGTLGVAGTTILGSNLSTVGQAAFYSSVQIQGGLSVFSTITAYNINFTSSITSNGLPFSGGGGTLSATSSFAQVALPLSSSRGICFDPSGNTYVFNTGNSVIFKITPQGVTSLFAGSVSGWADGTAGLLNTNSGQICYDSYTNCIAVADTTAVRLITLAGNIITMAGNGSTGNGTTPVSSAIFTRLTGICSDGSGNLYIVDQVNNNIKKITLNSSTPTQYGCTVANVAGSLSATAGYTNATGASALFNAPFNIAINTAKTFLYVGDLNNRVIRSISLPGNVVGTLAGALSSPAAGTTDSTTPTSVQFTFPIGLAIDGSGVYVSDYLANNIRYININPFYTVTLAGQPANVLNISGVGTNAQIYRPLGISLDPYGNPWISTDSGCIFNYTMATGYLNLFYEPTISNLLPNSIQNTSISSIVVPAMATETIFGAGFTTFNNLVSYVSPQGLVMDSQNNLFVSDKFKIRKVAVSGFVTSVFGDPANIQNNNFPYPGAEGQYNGSYQMCFDNETLYIADPGFSVIHIVNTRTGTVSNLAITGQALNNCHGVIFNAGTLYVSNTNILASPPAGYLVAINLSTGVSTLIAGSTTLGAFTNATGTSARFDYIYGICFDVAKANILICDRGNTAIRNYNISTGAVTTYSVGVAFPSFIASDSLGNYYATSGSALYKIVGGTATTFSTGFTYVLGVTVDSYNNIYVSDIVNNCIYFINPAGTLSTYSGTAGTSGTQDSLYASSLTVLAPYVGINKSNAQYTLDVDGTINFTGGLFNNGVIISDGSISTFSTLTVSSLNTNILNASTLSTVGQAAFYSSVQIQGSLSVFSSITARNINFTGILTSNGTTFSGAPPGINSAGSIGINSASNASYSLLVTGNQSNTGTLQVAGTTTLSNSSNTGTLGVAGAVTFGGTLNTGGNLTIATTSSARTDVYINTSSGQWANVYATVNDGIWTARSWDLVYYPQSGGAFQVWDINPQSNLFYTNLNFQTPSNISAGGGITASGNSGSISILGTGAGQTSPICVTGGGVTLGQFFGLPLIYGNSVTNPLLLQGSNGNVGILNNNLQVTAGIIYTQSLATGWAITSFSDSWPRIGFYQGDATVFNINDSTKKFIFARNNNEVASINGNGGIGASTITVGNFNNVAWNAASRGEVRCTGNGTTGISIDPANNRIWSYNWDLGTIQPLTILATLVSLSNTSNTGTLGVAGTTTLTNTSNTGTLGVAGTTTLTNTSNTGTLGVAGYTTLASNVTIGSGLGGVGTTNTLIRLNQFVANTNWAYLCSTDGLGDVSLGANCYTSNGSWYRVNYAGGFSFVSARQGSIKFWCGAPGAISEPGNTDTSLTAIMSLNTGGLTVTNTSNTGTLGVAGNVTIGSNSLITGSLSNTGGFAGRFVVSQWIKSTDEVLRLFCLNNGTTYFGSANDWTFQSSNVDRVTINSAGSITANGGITASGNSGSITVLGTNGGAGGQTVTTCLTGGGVTIGKFFSDEGPYIYGNPKLALQSANGTIVIVANNLLVGGSITGNSKNFRIDHPIVSSCTLVHASIEGPRYDLIYRNRKQLVNGSAEVDIEKESTANGSIMTPGTFDLLATNSQVFLQNNDSFDRVKGYVSSHMLFIECENSNSSVFIDWMVTAERHDSHLVNSDITDASGFLILEHYVSTISSISTISSVLGLSSISSINLDTVSTVST